MPENNDDKTVTHVVLTKGLDVSHYRIVERVGSGGMGEVYLADDTKLNRRVALKFLQTTMSQDADTRRRFVREAQAAAGLDHPNIVTVFEVSEFSGRPFFSMQYIKGKTLQHYCRQERLSVEQILDLGIGIANGLAQAHDRGIIHRDIKSANIVIDADMRPKILDFGLATIRGGEALTQAGSTLGTIAFMSPEQAQGKTVDNRSDLFSLGVVLYELLTGEPPFRKENNAATLNMILNVEPEPLRRHETDIPDSILPAVQAVITKCLAKSPETRYQTAEEFSAALQSVHNTLSSQSSRPAVEQVASTPSIAVLPFSNMSADAEQEYFCDGIAEDILNDLAQIDKLRVVSRTSSFAFKGKTEDLRDVGHKLNAATILEGSVRKAGNRLRITAQLINVADGYHLWSERYDKELDDVFAIQDEIAGNIVRALRIKLNPKLEAEKVKAPTDNMEAYELYLRGRAFHHGAGRKNTRFSIELFSSAIAKDPGYAQAYAGLAFGYANMFLYFDNDKSNVKKALETSKKALDLNPQLAEAHAARGLAVSLGDQYQEAEEEFKKAIELNSNLFEAYYNYARTCFAQGKHEMACKLYEQASSVNPDDYQALILAAGCYGKLGRPDKVQEALKRGFEIIERRLELNPDDVRAVYLGATALLELDEKEIGIEWMERAIAMEQNDPAVLYNGACFFSRLGQTERALELLDKTINAGFSHKAWIENDEDLANIRSHEGYQSILDKLSD